MNDAALREAIADGCAALNLRTTEHQLDGYALLLRELERWGQKVNLTAVRRLDEMLPLHLFDSLAVLPSLHGTTVIDIGTGAGFPGLPLAIACPDRCFLLLDSNGKKIGFVRHIISRLALDNVVAQQARAEDFAPEQPFDTVIARALATIPRIIELGAHLMSEKGVLLALKGKYPAAELEAAETLREQWDWQVEDVQVPGLEQHARHIVRLLKKG